MAKVDSLEKLASVAVYAGALIIIVWAILKSLHIIQSPVWMEMIPYFGGGMSLLAIAYQAGKLMQKVDEMAMEVRKLAGFSERILKIETKCDERHSSKR